MHGYKVGHEHFKNLDDARLLAESIMAEKPDGDAVIIWRGNGSDGVASPYKAVVRRNGNLVTKDW